MDTEHSIVRVHFVCTPYRQLHQVIIRTIVDIEIHITFDAWQFSRISVLPKFPFSP